jgi:hypothetical protein
MKTDYSEPSLDILSPREKVSAAFMELARNMEHKGNAAILVRFIGVFDRMNRIGEVGSDGKTGDKVLIELCQALGMVVPDSEEIIEAETTAL